MNALRSNRVKFGIVAIAAVLIFGIVGSALAVAGGFGGFKEATAVSNLQSARGIVFDWAEVADGRDFMISGEWTLKCKKACEEAAPHQIEFDMAFAMMREDVKAEANSSHGHQWSNFSATSASVDDTGNILTIVGTINGSGPIKNVGITLTLRRHSDPQHFTFFFDLSDGPGGDPPIIVTEVGGVVIESKGK